MDYKWFILELMSLDPRECQFEEGPWHESE